jgi:hypothetical protein
MRRISTLALATAIGAGCPAPTTVESVDGLSGGKLTSRLDVPDLGAEFITVETMTVGTVQAGAVIAQTIEASETLAAGAVDADSVSTERLAVRGYAVFGAPLGTVDYNPSVDGDGYRVVDGLCRASFGEVAHVCGAEEVMTAYRAGVDPPDTMHQAAVVTHAQYTTLRTFTGDEGQDNYVNIDDCDGWTNNQTFVFGGGSSTIRGAVTNSYGAGHTYMALDHDEVRDLWRLAPPFTNANCSQVKLACCG